jgi:YidC/Oxa1 family membrane protein insertase
VVVRCCLLPVNYRMQKSMRAYGAKMQKLKPKMEELKRRFADDSKRYQEAMLQFQRENKLMPPLGGCLPIFLTMPIYLGLFTALRTAYDLRHQRFLFIHDLSQSDTLFELGFWPWHFNILPLCWITMLVILQLRTPLPTDPQQRTPQLIARYLPVVFGVMLYPYAAGLMVYMVTSMLWTFVESALIKRKLGPIDPSAAAMAPPPMM